MHKHHPHGGKWRRMRCNSMPGVQSFSGRENTSGGRPGNAALNELNVFTINNDCRGCGKCARICPAGAISGEKGGIHAIDQGKCIQCGSCLDACRSGAVVIAHKTL
jgi:ferredoxin